MRNWIHYHIGSFLVLAGLFLGWGPGRANTFLELQSAYLGDGWFQYRLSVLNDPFFTAADITEFSVNFLNEIDHDGDTTNWSNTSWNSNQSVWAFTNGIPGRPYVETFAIRSSETSFRLAPQTNGQGAVVVLSLVLAELDPFWSSAFSGNIVGFADLPCLVPCAAADADGSPTNFVYDLKLLPDIQINHLIQTNGGIYGVDFSWDYAATFVLQGSSDLNNWTNITYLWSNPPETAWTTNQTLNAYGSFFRLEEVAGRITTNLPPLNAPLSASMGAKAAALAGAASTRPSVTGCRLENGKMVVSLSAVPG